MSNTTTSNFTEEEINAYLDFLNEETTKTMIPAIIMLIIFAIVGFIGNSIVLAVYSRKFGRTTTRVFIITIACFDLVSNTIVTPGEIYDMFHYWDFTNAKFCAFRMFFNAFTTISAALILLAVAVVRFRKVCRPFGWQISIPQTKIICLVTALTSALFSFPNSIVYGRLTKQTPRPGIVGYECTQDDAYVGTIWPIIVNGIFLLLFLASFIPLVVIYSMIGVQACRHSKIHGVSTSPTGPAKAASASAEDSQTSSSGAPTKSTNGSLDSTPSQNKFRVSFAKTDNGNRFAQEKVVFGDFPENLETVDLDHAKLSVENAEQEENQNDQNITSPDEEKMNNQQITEPTEESANTSTDKNKGIGQGKSDKKVRENPDLICDDLMNETQPDKETTITGKITHPPKYPRKSASTRSSGARFVRSISKKMSVVRLFRSRSSSAGEASNRKGISRTTIMLLTITLVFVVSLLPHLGCMFYKLAHPDVKMTLGELMVYNVFLRLYFLNSAANPIIYSLCDINFRKACSSLFAFGKKK